MFEISCDSDNKYSQKLTVCIVRITRNLEGLGDVNDHGWGRGEGMQSLEELRIVRA